MITSSSSIINDAWKNYYKLRKDSSSFRGPVKDVLDLIDRDWSLFLNCKITREHNSWGYFEWETEEEYLAAMMRLHNWDGEL